MNETKPVINRETTLVSNQEIQLETKQQMTNQEELQEHIQTQKIRDNFSFFIGTSALYALFYAFCLYRNSSGITSPFFVGGTLFYFCSCMKKLGVPLKKDAIFYLVSIILLGLSICLTDDARINSMSRWGILLLLISFMLHHFYQDQNWGLVQYLSKELRIMGNTVCSIFYPLTDFLELRKNKIKFGSKKIVSILLGIVLAFPLVLVVLLLLTSADAIFAKFVGDFFNMFLVGRNFQTVVEILFLMLVVFVLSYGFIHTLVRENGREICKVRVKKEATVAITVTGIISVIYVLFCAVQIGGLFVGEKLLPEGYSYSQYAREGFFQLLFICILNLGMVLFCMTYIKENKVLNSVLTLISICTYLLVFSSAGRMLLYIKEYHLTFLRVFVLWSLLVIFSLLTGVSLRIYRAYFPLFRYSMLVVTTLYLLLAFSKPDYWITKYNYYMVIKNQEDIDNVYSDSISADAAPILAEYLQEGKPSGWVENIIYSYFSDYRFENQEIKIRTFNVSRYLAGKEAEKIFKRE